jgi:DNA-binding response OmpR family regulator
VAVATDAVTAVSSAVRQPPDVVVMDIGLPGGDGMMVMQRLHALPQLAGVPVIVLSGRDPGTHRDAALAAGAAAYLVKPVAPKDLSAAVIEALGGAASPS